MNSIPGNTDLLNH